MGTPAARGAERRQHKRVYFDNGDEVTGVFGPLDQAGCIVEAKVLNLSLGGLYFTIDRRAPCRFLARDTIIMYELNAPEGLRVTSNIMVEVKRVEDQPIFGHIGYGCQFIELDPATRTRMARFLEWKFKQIKNGA